MSDKNKEARKKAAKLFLRRMTSRKIVIIGMVGTLFFVIMAVFAPLIATHDPNTTVLMEKLEDPSSAQLLGTDMYGRDIFSRVIYGSRVSLIIGVSSVLIATAIGSLLGMIAAYNGGIVDTLLMRFCDAWRAIPQIAVTTALVAIYGRSITSMATSFSPRNPRRTAAGRNIPQKSTSLMKAMPRVTGRFSRTSPVLNEAPRAMSDRGVRS